MNFKNTKDAYGLIAKFLHWITAFVILGLMLVGLYMVSLPYSPFKLDVYALHKSFGLLVLWLVGFRIIWKTFTVKPDPHLDHKIWERFLAKIVHVFLYIAMVGMPLSGWLMSSAGEYPVPFFGIQMPDLIGKNEDVAGLMNQTHRILAYLLIISVGLHAVGALKHHFVDRDTTLMRMMARPMKKVGPYILTFILGIFFIGVLFFSFPNKTEVVVDEVVKKEKLSTSNKNVPIGNGLWQIVEENSHIYFKAKVYGKEFTGEFKDFSGEIFFDPQHLDQSYANVEIDISQVDSGDSERDSQMLTKDWFYIKKYPIARFKSDAFIEQGDGNYIAKGNLIIKGQSVPIQFPFQLAIYPLSKTVSEASMQASFSLNRLDFNLGEGQWKSSDSVGFDVQVDVDLTALARK